MMPDRDELNTNNDMLVAFALGAVLGVGAALALKPEPSVSKRILKEIEPFRKRVKRDTRRMGRHIRHSAGAGRNASQEVGRAGRVIARELRKEFAGALA